ncbi:MAG TPA: exodeoxyribonuclease V subunit gamma, partial [Polyangiaceae bacterium]
MRKDNRLLVSLGKVGSDFQAVLENAADYVESDVDLFVDPGLGSALSVLQSDVLALRRRARDAELDPLPLSPGDDSVRVHACHSPQRELEVLRDQMLDLFERDATLGPHDVVVMMPNVEAYAPFVEAVFGDSGEEAAYLPYRILDRPRVADNVAADALLRVLDVLGGRMKASAVLDLLQLEPVRSRFGIAAEQLSQLRRWAREVNVRWGIDAAHRRAHGQPGEGANTWRFGLERLLLGYCLPGEDKNPFASVMPYDDVEGEAATVLGSFAEFCETLFRWARRVERACPPRAWVAELAELSADLLATAPADAWQTEELSDELSELAAEAARGGFEEALGLRALRHLLRARLGNAREGTEFSDVGITFSALLPMRSIPFRVVCLLGMNDGEFPRAEPHPAFNRLSSDQRAGDRSLREEDRYLFLEALLSAREKLIVTYVGRGIKDGSERPPAAVVSELLDVFRESFGLEDGAREPVVVHPLQPFSPRYFGAGDDPRLFGFGQSRLSGARALVQAERRVPGLQSAPLPGIELPELLPLDVLTAFFEHPARGLFERRLGVELRERVDLVLDREPVELDALERYAIGSLLLERALERGDPADELEAARARGVLPYGVIGACAFEDLRAEVTAVAEAARPWLEGERLPPAPLELHLAGTTLVGALRDVWPRAQVWQSYQRGHPRRALSLWIRHLVLQCMAGASLPRHTVLIGRPDLTSDSADAYRRSYQALDPELARALLEDLLRLYSIGQTVPLCLFPAASLAYVEALAKYDGKADRQERAFKVAREQLYGAVGFKTFKEMDDP